MINWQTILSSFDDKPTLMQWLKMVEKALQNAENGFSLYKHALNISISSDGTTSNISINGYFNYDKEFTLDQMYEFEKVLANRHPENHHIKDKIRQQLQVLRYKGIVEFKGRGHYRKI